MSSHGSTKDKVLKLIAEGSNNLTSISDALGLAPSTVSKHLHDLESAGLIEEGDNHTKKWKYYKISRVAGQDEGRPGWSIIRNRAVVGASVMSMFFLLAFIFITATPQAGVVNSIPISITDPPSVPVGTQALYMNYSSLMAHVVSKGSSEWVDIDSSGRIDLMGLINVSQVIGGLNVSAGSVIDAVAFNISSASTTIDNTTYPVRLLRDRVVASVENNTRLNSSSGVLLDFSPVVVESYTGNVTSFVMIPSVRAVLMPYQGKSIKNLHQGIFGQVRYPLPPIYRHAFAASNITVSNQSLSISGGNLSFVFSLSDTGSKNVTVIGVALEGQEAPCQTGGTWGAGLGGCPGISPQTYQQSNGSVDINADAVYRTSQYNGNGSFTIRLPRPATNISIYGIGGRAVPPAYFMGFSERPPIAFIVESNGTLTIPVEQRLGFRSGSFGYALAPHSSAHFSYHGAIYGPWAMMPGMLADNVTYRIAILTNEGIIESSVTAV